MVLWVPTVWCITIWRFEIVYMNCTSFSLLERVHTVGQTLRAVEKSSKNHYLPRFSPSAGLIFLYMLLFDRPALTVMGDNHVSRVLSNAMPSHVTSPHPIWHRVLSSTHTAKARAIVRSEQAGDATMDSKHCGVGARH